MSTFKKNDKRTINAWAIFDWANSAYALVISTAIFPIFFTEYTPEQIDLFGMTIDNSTLYSYAVSFSYFIIVLISPILSGIADYGGKRLYFLKRFTLIGSISCILLYFFKGEPQLWLGTSAFILASIGFAGSIVFYNAYLPEIVTEDRYDRVSAKGFAYGYVGSVILLVVILAMIQKPLWFGLPENSNLPARIGFVLVGLWWLGFAQITFRRLPQDTKQPFEKGIILKGFQEIKQVFGQLKDQSILKRFLLSFFFYSAGVQTIIYVATVFAKKELHFDTGELITIVLVLQLVGIAGAYFFAWLSDKRGNKFSLLSMLLIWMVVCAAAYFVDGKMTFRFIAAAVGLVMGGIQALSRSTYSKLLQSTTKDVTSYFSFYDVLFKGAIVFGSLLYGLAEQLTGDIRNSVLAMGLLFVIGFVIMLFTDLKSGFRNTAE